MRRTSLAIVLGVALAGVGTIATAARNSSGSYTLPNSPFVAGTSISSSAVNQNFSDIASELSDSASRSGKGGFSAPIRGPDGTQAAPSHAFVSETGSGWWRQGSGDVALSVLGQNIMHATTAGAAVTGTLGVSGDVTLQHNLSVTGATTLTGGAYLGAQITGMTRASLPAIGQQISSSCGNFTSSGVTFADVTNLAATLTTSGRPVVLSTVPDGSSSGQAYNLNTCQIDVPNGSVSVRLLRGATEIARWGFNTTTAGSTSWPCSLHHVDPVGAGTYTYKLQIAVGNGATAGMRYVALAAYEL